VNIHEGVKKDLEVYISTHTNIRKKKLFVKKLWSPGMNGTWDDIAYILFRSSAKAITRVTCVRKVFVSNLDRHYLLSWP